MTRVAEQLSKWKQNNKSILLNIIECNHALYLINTLS